MFTNARGDRRGVPNVAILITDGVSSINPHRTIPEALEAKERGTHIFTIDIALPHNVELNAITSTPLKDNRFSVKEFRQLRDLIPKVFTALYESSSGTSFVIKQHLKSGKLLECGVCAFFFSVSCICFTEREGAFVLINMHLYLTTQMELS